MSNQFGFLSDDTFAEKMDTMNQFLAAIATGQGGSLKPTSFVKEQLHIKHYVRYNDDFIIIHEDKAYLQECLIKIDAWISSRGLKLSPKKTQLFKVTQGIKFLGFRFRLAKTGKVVMTLLPEKLSHERRKLRKLVSRAKQGYMTKEEVDRCYESWKAHVGNESTLLMVLVATRLDLVTGTNFIRDAVVIAFIANETISIVENAGLMGINIPPAITSAIEVLKKKSDSADNTDQ